MAVMLCEVFPSSGHDSLAPLRVPAHNHPFADSKQFFQTGLREPHQGRWESGTNSRQRVSSESLQGPAVFLASRAPADFSVIGFRI